MRSIGTFALLFAAIAVADTVGQWLGTPTWATALLAAGTAAAAWSFAERLGWARRRATRMRRSTAEERRALAVHLDGTEAGVGDARNAVRSR